MLCSYPHCILLNADKEMCFPAPQHTWCFVIPQVRAEHARMVSIYTATGSTQCKFSFFSRNRWLGWLHINWCIFFHIHSFMQQTINSRFFTLISAYPAHGYSSNSSYANQGSWYSYPANGYAGGYSAYPGASGYWNNANDGPSSHSNMATNPQPSQTMVQYPVCPRQPHSYLVQVNARKRPLFWQP